MGKEKTKVLCSVRCSHCKEFGHFRKYTKADGHYRGVFHCKKCRDDGVPFPGDEAIVEEHEVKEEENTGITYLLLGNNKPKKLIKDE
jgi:hypothetical protein